MKSIYQRRNGCWQEKDDDGEGASQKVHAAE